MFLLLILILALVLDGTDVVVDACEDAEKSQEEQPVVIG
jgi:hypothetical protein